MDIKQRINARKIVLSYFYQHCFFSSLKEKPLTDGVSALGFLNYEEGENDKKSDFLDADFLKAVAEKKQADEHWDDIVQAKLNTYAEYTDIENEFPYILGAFFDQRSDEEVEIDYVLQIGNALPRYEKELIEKVNQHTKTFGYAKMDIMDQVLLLLGYCEYQVLHTPKEVIINEMVELAKRYADDGSPKLINGILHELFTTSQD